MESSCVFNLLRRILESLCIKKTVKFIARCLRLIGDIDVLSEYSQCDSVFLSTIIINNEIAAYCEGGFNNNNVLSIARVATNLDYYHFSPGQILLIETIESIRETVRYFDLTRGLEEYKFKLGGCLHNNYKFTISCIS